MMFNGDFTPVLAKHSKNFSLQDCLCIGVERMQRNFEPMKRQVEQWQESQIPDVTAKLIIYRAFVDGELEAPSSLMVAVHRNYFQPPRKSSQREPSGAYATPSPFKELDPLRNSKPQPSLGSSSRKDGGPSLQRRCPPHLLLNGGAFLQS